MSAQVDVLAVMDACCADPKVHPSNAAAMTKARAAVAALIAERDALREALLKLVEAADMSDKGLYGTLATGFVRDIARTALTPGESA